MNGKQKFRLTIDGIALGEVTRAELEHLNARKISNGLYHLIGDHQSMKVELVEMSIEGKFVILKHDYRNYKIEIEDELDALIHEMGFDKQDATVRGHITAPMPGLVLDILVGKEETVQEGTPLLILEAMKMENVIKSTGEGIVSEIYCSRNQKVEKGENLILLS